MIDFTFTAEQETLLRDQVIDLERPGPVLSDFETLLNFVGTAGVKAAGKYNLLPIDAIDTLDQQLTRPLRLALARPQLRSHPYLQGLHLLLRASGLGGVYGVEAKARLAVDPNLLAGWRALNPTERYFTLLEAWLRRSQNEMIGERGVPWGGSGLMPSLTAWREIPAKGKRFDLAHPANVYFFGIGRGFYHLALMDLFGLMEVEHARTLVQPWCPAGVKHLPFGDAIFTLLAGNVLPGDVLAHDEDDEDEPADDFRFGKWQPLLQPYFPEWHNNLALPRPEARTGTYVFKVALPDMWRRIAISADATLDGLAAAILRSVRFDFDHLYEFTYRDQFGATVQAVHPESDGGAYADEVLIGTLPLEPGQSMQFLYDYGESWRFTVKLERIEPAKQGPRTPKVLEKHGKAPQQYPRWD